MEMFGDKLIMEEISKVPIIFAIVFILFFSMDMLKSNLKRKYPNSKLYFLFGDSKNLQSHFNLTIDFFYVFLFSTLFVFETKYFNIDNSEYEILHYIAMGFIFLLVSTKFLPRNELKNSKITTLWIKRFLYYLIIGLIIFYYSNLFFSNIGFLKIDPDSARYMISALVQSEAAILAIVITLSLVAVQQTATSYSPRVVKIFVSRNPDFWILIGIYIMTMVYGLWLITQINENLSGNLLEYSNYIIFNSFEKHIHSIISLAIFSFIILVPYILATLDLLRPSKIIDFLSENINTMSLIDQEQNSIQPIIDIVISSMMKHDYETVRNGLEAMTNKVIYLIQETNLFQDHDPYGELNTIMNYGHTKYITIDALVYKIIKQIEKVGIISIDNLDRESLNEVVNSLCKIGEIMATRKLPSMIFLCKSFEKIGKLCAKKQLDFILFDLISSILKVKAAFNIEKKMDLIFTKQEIDFTKFKEAFPEGVILEPNLALIFEQNKLGLALDILLTSTIQNIIMEAEKQGLNDCINLIYDELIKEKFPDISRHSHMFYEGYA